jgi:hypothetical protein
VCQPGGCAQAQEEKMNTMTQIQRITLLLLAVLVAPWSLAGDLSGVWLNEDQPAWIEIQFSDGQGTGTVRRNDNKPEAVGRVLIKDLVVEEGGASWVGQIYAERFKEFKDATITLPEPERMQIVVSVGFMSRTVNWIRVTEEDLVVEK